MFYIAYYSHKDKKHITRRGKHDEKSKFGVNKKTGNKSNIIVRCISVMRRALQKAFS